MTARIVITGIGVISPYGVGQEFYGKSSSQDVPEFVN